MHREVLVRFEVKLLEVILVFTRVIPSFDPICNKGPLNMNEGDRDKPLEVAMAASVGRDARRG